ncbi:hypothetical protein CsatB_004546 [Cannabis sativa]
MARKRKIVLKLAEVVSGMKVATPCLPLIQEDSSEDIPEEFHDPCALLDNDQPELHYKKRLPLLTNF